MSSIYPVSEKASKRLLYLLWFILPIMAVLPKIIAGPKSYNNYLIYKYVFWHSWFQQPMFAFYPDQHLYQNHYGPTFSAVIGLFALMPDAIGILLWSIASAGVLFYAIQRLPISIKSKWIVMVICLIEMVGTVQNQQFNTIVCAGIMLSFVYLYEKNIPAAAFFIAGGILTKLYGIVGLAFVPFSGRFKQMTIWMIIAIIMLFVLPMLWSDPSYIIKSYMDWFERLVMKNQENIHTNVTDGMQDLSFMGMVRRITGLTSFSNLWFIIPAAVLLIIPIFKFDHYKSKSYQLTYLAQVMIGLVIFSTSAESPTYIIAVSGFAIWFAQWDDKKPKWLYGLLILMFLLTILSYSDIYPKTFRNEVIKRYALKAFPCVVTWLVISWRLLFFKESNLNTA